MHPIAAPQLYLKHQAIKLIAFALCLQVQLKVQSYLAILILFIAMRNMVPKSFYKSSYRRVTCATTVSEKRNLVETIERPRSVVLLPLSGGDECDQASDNEEVPQDVETAFEPAGVLKVEEDINDEEKDQIDFLTERTKRRSKL